MSGRKRVRKNSFKEPKQKRRAKISWQILVGLKLSVAAVSILLLSSTFILGYDFLTQLDYFKTDRIEVEGIKQLTREAVIDQAQITRGVNILSINLATTRKRLLAHPLIAEAGVRRAFPSRIRLSIREHEPLAILDLGRQFLINTQGNVYKENSPA
ncbi:MAG: FtsQ-type POTRA domain-containing protein, partial [Desulfobacterales bacterium]